MLNALYDTIFLYESHILSYFYFRPINIHHLFVAILSLVFKVASTVNVIIATFQASAVDVDSPGTPG